MIHENKAERKGFLLALKSVDQSALETIAREIGVLARDGDIITLEGGLGAGKTTFARSCARGAGVAPEIPVTSPTFAVIQEYQGRVLFRHADLYRLTGEDDLLSTGIEEYLDSDGVLVVEWPDRFGTLMPARHLQVVLDLLSDTHRAMTLQDYGGQWYERLCGLKKRLTGM